jgi:hypothetical protein
MKGTWSSIFEAALVGGGVAVATAGCGADALPPIADAGCPGTADAGCPAAADAGCPAVSDAGCPAVSDAGCPAVSDAGCPAVSDAGCPAVGDPRVPDDPADFVAWLDARGYAGAGWHCDDGPQPPLADSPHGDNTICVNDLLWDARRASGEYPRGAAAVKVTFDDEGRMVNRYLDVRRATGGGAASWYFYVAGGPGGSGDSDATSFCAACHAAGGRDYVRRVPDPE